MCARAINIFKMEALISSYGINFANFKNTIITTYSLVAGSSALAEYLKQDGIDPGFQPNDIDIFVHYCYINSNYTAISKLLKRYGFIKNDKFTEKDTEYYEGSLNEIRQVTSFTNQLGKEIQLIVIDTNSMIKYITNDFDISACISWWNASENRFETINPYTTKRKEMYYTGSRDQTDERVALRTAKYIQRGFKLIDKPCPFIKERDNRNELNDNKFDDINVMDIFTLDEINIRDFLKQGDSNIILKAGNSYYAFNRGQLIDYMCNKKINTGIGDIYETPFNQSITREAFFQLQYADYSIYELKSAYSVSVGNKLKSLFHLHCYSIKDWIECKEGGIVLVPNATILTNILPQVFDITYEDIIAAQEYFNQPGNLEEFYNEVLMNAID
jgi:hypothetical protein